MLDCSLVKLTGPQIKKIIMEQSVRLKLFHLVVAGLPFSGKSTLVNSLFGVPGSEKIPDHELHEASIRRNEVTGASDWTESSKLNSDTHTIRAALEHFFIKERLIPKLNPDYSDLKVFDDAEIQGYFEATYRNLCQLNTASSQFENGSLMLMNVFDPCMNKAMIEFMMAILGHNRNMLLLDVMNMKEYSTMEKLLEPLNLKDRQYQGKYTKEYEISIYEGRSAMHHLLLPMQAAALSSAKSYAKSFVKAELGIPQSHAPSNILLIGTHADELEKPNECRSTVLKNIELYCHEMGCQSILGDSIMIPVNATDVNDCEKVKKALLKLIDSNKSFSIDLPVKFIFLRYVLYCTKKVFMSRKKVLDFARECGINGDKEIDDFFKIFRDCASIISSYQPKDFLYDHVILLPGNFLRDLNKLYCIENNKSLLPEQRSAARVGIVDKAVVTSLWKDDSYKFFVGALKTVGLLMDLPRRSGKYFVPSIRSKHNAYNSNHRSCDPIRLDSLIIHCSMDDTLAPFSSKQCIFVEYLLESADFQFIEECNFYNSIEFRWKDSVKISIRFFCDFIEVYVDPSNISPTDTSLYSILKTGCVAILNTIERSTSKSFKSFDFCFVCPKSDPKPINSHAVKFDILSSPSSSEEAVFECEKCEKKFLSHEVEGIHWVRAAYQGDKRAVIPRTG